MIKVKAAQPPSTAIEYPVLARSRDSGMVVLFVKSGAGVVLDAGTGANPVGFYQTIWSSVSNHVAWEILPSSYSLTISNG